MEHLDLPIMRTKLPFEKPVERTENGHNEETRPPEYAPWLYQRFAYTAGSGRLSDGTVPPGFNWYTSPYITFGPVDGLGNVRVGDDVTVSTTIFNAGLATAVSTLVEFFWFNPSLAFVPTPNNKIGQKLVTVPPGQSTVVACPKLWVPQKVNSDGHQCLVVQCNSPSEGTNGLKLPFNAALDRHVAQRNLTALDISTAKMIFVDMANPFQQQANFTVTMKTTVVKLDLKSLQDSSVAKAVEIALALSNGMQSAPVRFKTSDLSDKDLGIKIGVKDRFMFQPVDKSERSQHAMSEALRHGAKSENKPSARTLLELSLDANEAAILAIEIPKMPLDDGMFIVLAIEQLMGGVSLGSYGVVLALP